MGESQHFADAKRAHEFALQYWELLRKERPLPSESDIDQQSLAPIWDSCFLITLKEANNESKGFHYEYVGKELLEAYGRDMTGLAADHADVPQITSMLSAMENAMQGKPVVDESVFTNSKGVEIRYRCSLLPLGTGEKVEYILGCMRWKNC